MREPREAERKKWGQLVEEQKQSGQTVKEFCGERGLREWQFFAWKKRLKEAEALTFVEVKVKATEENRCVALPSDKAIEVRLKQGRSLMVGPGFDAQHLRSLLRVLEAEA
jgi:transposase